MKNLVWITNSFRCDSRLTHNLKGECTFVYYSPYYFAGNREKSILSNCSQDNLNAFYHSINEFDCRLKEKGFDGILIFKESDPINHINELCYKFGFDRVIIDQPLFAMWHTIDLLKLNVSYDIVDSALIDDECFKMTAKSRWTSHIKKIDSEPIYDWNSSIIAFNIPVKSQTYPKPKTISRFMDLESVISRAKRISYNYGLTRDLHNGQTQLSTAIQNGVCDPHNIFFNLAENFRNNPDINLFLNEGSHASMLRQFAFREINIIIARKNGLTMEDSPLVWAKALMHHKSYDNMISARPKPESTLNLNSIKNSNTGIKELDSILSHFNDCGIMPNRARMFFAGKIFYESKSGIDALNLLIDTFDLLGIDGQCPNNYIQCVNSMNLAYGKVMLMSAKRTFDLLKYPT